ncbi:MAG: LicD family protein [Candidatus Marinamargulisbacteria bacterium]
MKKNIPSKLNTENLIEISKLIGGKIPYFVFFGTLLGITRNGKIIENDDDIDIYINIKDRKKLIDTLILNNYNICLDKYPNTTDTFLQVAIKKENYITLIDFYFYTKSKHILIEKWNFNAIPNKKNYHLHIPNNIVFPIKNHSFQGENICIPYNSPAICTYLYGKKWKNKFLKKNEYQTLIILNRPCIFIGKYNKFLFKILVKAKKILPI